MTEEAKSEFEKGLILEIGRIDDEIRKFTLEKMVLQRMLARAKRANIDTKETGRKNSGVRIITESSVIRALKEKGRPMSLQALYKEAQEFNFDLKYATFRGQVHRMMTKGLIVSAGRKMWKLPPQNSN